MSTSDVSIAELRFVAKYATSPQMRAHARDELDRRERQRLQRFDNDGSWADDSDHEEDE